MLSGAAMTSFSGGGLKGGHRSRRHASGRVEGRQRMRRSGIDAGGSRDPISCAGRPSDLHGASPMKQNDLLSATSILSVLLLALHISQDIVFGFDRAGLNHLVGVAILLVILCGAVLLKERAWGKVI